MKKGLENLLRELEQFIPQQDVSSPAISKASTGWHIEHALLTLTKIIDALASSDPGYYEWRFSFRKWVVLTFSKILRGRAQAPASVQPGKHFTVETLGNHLQIAREKLNDLENLSSDHYFEHPLFGKVNLKPAVKFLGIHTQHHLTIINEIIKNN